MRQILLSQQSDGTWTYTLMLDGRPVGCDGGYEAAADAATDAESCPTSLDNYLTELDR